MIPLSASELSELTERLDRRYRQLLAEVRDALEHSENRQYIELTERMPADAGDQSVASALADLNIAMLERHVAELREIEAAKARIRDGTYGICIECGEPIGFERLSAYPTAERCIRCQQRRERIYAHANTPTL